MPILRSDLLTAARFVHAFPERDVGDADLRAALGAEAIAQAKQVHGAVCVEATVASAASAAFGVSGASAASAAFGVSGASAAFRAGASAASGGSGGLGVEADGIVARPDASRRAAAGVRVADCVPVLLADEASGAVAAIHAGWRGVVGGVLSAGVARLLGRPEAERSTAPVPAAPRERAVATSASALIAAIGPCIGACCFEVGADVAEAIERAAGTGGVVARRAGEKAFVDLRRAVRAQLLALGVPSTRIEDVPGCTKHEPTRFHSFRRDGKDSGRMLAAISPRSYG